MDRARIPRAGCSELGAVFSSPERYFRDATAVDLRELCKTMRKLCGTVLVLAGVSVGTYALWSGKNAGGSPPRTSGVASMRAPTPAGQIPAENVASVPAALRSSAVTAANPPKALKVADAARWVAYPPFSGRALDRARLTREIQLQLKGIGCYRGTIDGVWSATVRRSMKAFTDRVNATLPVEQPDIVLLAMLQSHQGRACGMPCPPGQSLAVDARCLPNGLIARVGGKQAPAGSMLAATASPSVGEKLAVGQPHGYEAPMSLAGPPLPPATPAGQPATGPPLCQGSGRGATHHRRRGRCVFRPFAALGHACVREPVIRFAASQRVETKAPGRWRILMPVFAASPTLRGTRTMLRSGRRRASRRLARHDSLGR